MYYYILTQTAPNLDFDTILRTATTWFIAGTIFCIIEFILPPYLSKSYRFVPLMMSFSFFLICGQLATTNILRYFPSSGLIVYWMAISLAGVVWIRPLFSKKKQYKLAEATEAKTLTVILPGETGRVLYEGVSWLAYCEQQQDPIAPNQKVYVLRREGNILIIAPTKIFKLS